MRVRVSVRVCVRVRQRRRGHAPLHIRRKPVRELVGAHAPDVRHVRTCEDREEGGCVCPGGVCEGGLLQRVQVPPRALAQASLTPHNTLNHLGCVCV